MDEKNNSNINLASILLVFAVIIIIIMGLCIFKLNNNIQDEMYKNTELEEQIAILNKATNNLQKETNIVKENDNNGNNDNIKTISGTFAQNQPDEDPGFVFDAGDYVFKEDGTVENGASATKYGTYTINNNIINIHWTKIEDDEIDENSEIIIKDENTLLVIDYNKEKGSPINWINGSVFYRQNENNTEDDNTTLKLGTYTVDQIKEDEVGISNEECGVSLLKDNKFAIYMGFGSQHLGEYEIKDDTLICSSTLLTSESGGYFEIKTDVVFTFKIINNNKLELTKIDINDKDHDKLVYQEGFTVGMTYTIK